MITREQTFLLTLLADHLNGRPTASVPDGIDWREFLRVCRARSFAALAYVQCGEMMPPEVEGEFLREYAVVVKDFNVWQQTISEMDEAFTRQGVPFAPFKGLEIAACYPQPDVRKMCDLDVLVRPADKLKAHEILLSLGFKSCIERDMKDWPTTDWPYARNGWKIELHDHLLYTAVVNSSAASTRADEAWACAHPIARGSRHRLEPDFHFVFLLMHLKKHVAYEGAGLRYFFDLAAAVRKWPLNWEKVTADLQTVGLLDFARVCLTLCKRWFEVESPLALDKMEAEVEEQALRNVFREEFRMDKVRDGVLVMYWRELKKTGWKGFLLSWSAFFPGYVAMRERFPFVGRHPWALPAAWFYRIARLAWWRFRVSERAADAHAQALKNWGL